MMSARLLLCLVDFGRLLFALSCLSTWLHFVGEGQVKCKRVSEVTYNYANGHVRNENVFLFCTAQRCTRLNQEAKR